jgi:NAD(P)-dependent dehydrogenase (short-subunit alcohol dehydrogenase family)
VTATPTPQVSVVTGAAGNLGPVWTAALLDAGHRVAALTLEGTQDDPALAALRERHPASLEVLVVDVTDRTDLEQAADQVEKLWGVATVLVNNAGVDAPPRPGQGALLHEIPADTFLRVLEVNVVGAFQAMQVFGSRMAAAGGGSIVNVGSLYASVSPDRRMYDHLPMDPPFLKPPAYGASKAGLVNLTRYFATHLAPDGVRVNTLSPGGVAGGQDPEFLAKFCARVPLGRLADPTELVGPLLFLTSDASSYVTGTELRVDGGFTAW